MSEYDSILKEKKKKVVSAPVVESKRKRFPTVIISFIAVIIILVSSYIIYFNTILAGSSIIVNDFLTLKEQYSPIVSNLYLDNLFNNSINANILINNNLEYIYFRDMDNYYLKTPSLSKYVNNNIEKNISIDLDNLLENVSKDKYIKTFFVKNKIPIVESNLFLERVDLQDIFNCRLINEYEVIITAQNHAFTNDIIMFKVVITDKITTDRKVIILEHNNIYYKDSDKELRFSVNIRDNDFSIKVYRSEELYSVITGVEKLNTYNYAYQIIDRLYTINLITYKNNDSYRYEFTSNIDKVEESFVINVDKRGNDLVELINYEELVHEDKTIYDNEYKYLLEFIDKYKNDIQNINN